MSSNVRLGERSAEPYVCWQFMLDSARSRVCLKSINNGPKPWHPYDVDSGR
jgi:hypothetical protein